MIRRKKRAGGPAFFITLLSLSAIVIFAIYFSASQAEQTEKASMISFYEKFAVNDNFLAQLPSHYTQEGAEAVHKEVSDFFKAAWSDQVNKTALYEVSEQIETIMLDRQIVETEVQSLLTLIRKRREM